MGGVDKLNEEKVEIEAVLGVTGGGYGAADPYAADEIPADDIYAYALYDYEAQGEGELSFVEGDSLRVLLMDESGWWEVELNGVVGIAPSKWCRCRSRSRSSTSQRSRSSESDVRGSGSGRGSHRSCSHRTGGQHRSRRSHRSRKSRRRGG